MLKLSRRSDEPFWLDLLPGVRVRLKPISVAMLITARRSAYQALDHKKAEGETEVPPLTDEQLVNLDVGIVSSLAHQGIVEWEGIGDAEGNAAPVSPQNIDDLLDVIPAYDALNLKYLQPATAREAEKNG